MRRADLAAAALLAALLACGGAGPEGNGRVGERAPAYAAATLDGDTLALSDLRGRPVLLNIWATWCGPCREELPALQRVADEYGARGLEVVGVSIDQGAARAAVRQFLGEHAIRYRILLDPGDNASRVFATVGVPETLLIDGRGVVRARWIGQVAREQLTPAVEQVLAASRD